MSAAETANTRPTVILGGGLTGLSAALHSQHPTLLLERDTRLGGLARSETREGYTFDHTGHWLHLRDNAMKALVKDVMGEGMVEVEREARIYSHGALTLYPFQANLHGLPPKVVHECLYGFVNSLISRSEDEPRNFEEYILHHFGAGIARHFMIPYNHKLWGVHPREITSAWCKRFVPRPNPEQVIAGAVGAGPAQLGYNIRFRYPKQGGIEGFTSRLAARLDPQGVRLSVAPDALDAESGTLFLGDEELPYHALITSIPLPKLIALLKEPPPEVVQAGSALRATALRYLNVATRRPAKADYHWAYVPEARYPFYRVGIFSNAVPTMAPKGGSSFYVELSTRSPLDENAKRDALEALVAMGAIDAMDDVLFADERVIDPAYVIFDEAYERSLETIHGYLESKRIFSRGRYGAWIYNAMEDSLLAGKEAAQRADALDPWPE
ncbi:MAG: NAD(P)-binding protein [Deltaproteobacteria bacterium]|nr:NAD(P)-binding protein [Deltaproteobacteria bacterium]